METNNCRGLIYGNDAMMVPWRWCHSTNHTESEWVSTRTYTHTHICTYVHACSTHMCVLHVLISTFFFATFAICPNWLTAIESGFYLPATVTTCNRICIYICASVECMALFQKRSWLTLIIFGNFSFFTICDCPQIVWLILLLY